MRVGLITLGCDKNTVDNEYLAGLLVRHRCDVVFLPEDGTGGADCDAVVVTSCGFIADAKQESAETLVALAEQKTETGHPARIYVTGCLSQRYAAELLAEVPELDGLAGVGQLEELADLIAGTPAGVGRNLVRETPLVRVDRPLPRLRSDRRPFAFLKIADGCNHACAFCAIPIMKGRLQSVAPSILIQEARQLLDDGARELVLVAQDTTAYGRDLDSGARLTELLDRLCALEGDFWIRIMYCYPSGVDNALLDVMARQDKILPYLDIPLQHFHPKVLRLMKRPAPDLDAGELIAKLRGALPDLTLRTTMLVGFPGETDDAHQFMLAQMKRFEFHWLGAFQYSEEEDTLAARAENPVPMEVREERWHAVMSTQADITRGCNQARIGRTEDVLIEDRQPETGLWIGRTAREAPDVDGSVLLETDRKVEVGQVVPARITDCATYDLYAQPEPGVGKPRNCTGRGTC